jgi:hypothetical protein
MAMRKHWCPNCNQGWVVPVRIRSTGKIIFVCDESEETWLTEEDIVPTTWSEVPVLGHYSYLNQVMKNAGLGDAEYEGLEWLKVGEP